MINSYPSVYALGHKSILDIFSGPVLVEEKIDGSQFSFGMLDGILHCRSKGKELIIDAPEMMFTHAVETAKELSPLLHPDWIYRGEYLQKPKHNTLAYDRAPDKHIIIFDVQTGIETYLSPDEKRTEAARIGLECVPCLFTGIVESQAMFNSFLDRVSILGGSKIEGVVIKNYSLITQEKKIAIGKYVSESFKEVHSGEWRKNNPAPADILQELIEKYRTPARWNKAIQHLKENGTLDVSPRDIGALMKEVPNDTQKECEAEIKDILFDHFWPKIRRGITSGLPEWYKEELLKSAFENVG